MAAEEPYIKKDKMTIKVSKRNKIINKMHKNDRNIDCIFTCFDEYLLYNDSFLFETLRNCETIRGSFYPLTTELC